MHRRVDPTTSLVESDFAAASIEERKRRIREEAFQQTQKLDGESSSSTWHPRRPTRRNAMWLGCKATNVQRKQRRKVQNKGVKEMHPKIGDQEWCYSFHVTLALNALMFSSKPRGLLDLKAQGLMGIKRDQPMNDHLAQGHGVVDITDLKAMGVAAGDRHNPPEVCASVLVETITPRTMDDPAYIGNGAAKLIDAIDMPLGPTPNICMPINASSELSCPLGEQELSHESGIVTSQMIDPNHASCAISCQKDGDVTSLALQGVTTESFQGQVPDDTALLPRVVVAGVEHELTRGNPEHPNKFGLETTIPQSHHSMDSVDDHPSDPRGGDGALCNSRIADTARYADGNNYLEPMKRSDSSQDLPPVEPVVSSTITIIPSILSRLGSFVRSAIPLLPVYVLRPFVNGCVKKDYPKLLDATIALHRHAMRLYVPGQPALVALRSNLAIALLTRSKRQGNSNDLDEAIEHSQRALLLRPEGHPERSSSLNNLATALVARFDKQCDGKDLEVAIKYYRSALLLRPEGHPDRSYLLHDLAEALVRRFDGQDDEQDLDEAIKHHRSAMFLRPDGHPERSSSLDNLACTLLRQWWKRRDGKILDEAFEHLQSALLLRSDGHPERASSLSNLADALVYRFFQQHDGRDIDEAIKHLQSALLLLPDGHPERSSSLDRLRVACTVAIQWAQQCDGKVHDEAAKHLQSVLLLQPDGHLERSSSLDNFPVALLSQWVQQRDGKALDEAIKHLQSTLLLQQPGHTERPYLLLGLADALRSRFEQQQDGKDLDEAIEHLCGALLLWSEGHPERALLLNCLGIILLHRFDQQRDEKDLDEAIKRLQSALLLRPDGHPDRSSSLLGLADALSRRFDQQRDGKDIEEAIELYRASVFLRPEGHPHRSSSLNGLAVALRQEEKDIDESIDLHRSALLLRPEGHPDRASSLHGLAVALVRRFDQQRDEKDIQEAINLDRSALLLRPAGHPDRAWSLNNLATVLVRWSSQLREKGIHKAIRLHHSALLLRPDGHPDQELPLNGLAVALVRLFVQQHAEKYLDEAIMHCRSALLLRPEGHPNRPSSLTHLAAALIDQYHQHHDGKDLDEASDHCQTAEDCTPATHPLRLTIHQTFASVHLSRWHTSLLEEHFHHAMRHYASATACAAARPLSRLQVSLAWVRAAETHRHDASQSALDAYAWCLRLLDSHISAAMSISSRYNAMKHFPVDLSVDAASCALRCGNVPLALELLEQGRALLWTQLARFHTLLDDLRSSDPRAGPLVKRFQQLSSMLKTQRAHESFNEDGARVTVDVEAEALHYEGLAAEWNNVVEEIRTFEGFSRFLLPPLFLDLREAACEGPVIVLIASKFSCDAVIVLHRQPPIHIPLAITMEWLKALAARHRTDVSENKTCSPEESLKKFVIVLRELWKEVVFPVVTQLKAVVEKGSRIWWCPTSIFTSFPLHAAGEYRPGKSNLSQNYISSYTPTLMALVKARKNARTGNASRISFAAIGQAQPGRQWALLPFVEQELDSVERSVPASLTTLTKLTSSLSTREAASWALQNNRWVHIACHGQQHFEEPFKSSFAMRDGPLSLLDIIGLDLSHHEFAFLSACKTAMGDSTFPDEVIHLAAGLQFTGVKSVVGTLWQCRNSTRSSAKEIAWTVRWQARLCTGPLLGYGRK
ncbi:TPR-like protein [Paxillus ammoniavirescens]|nr:TPR-like protein [Paxillus ammoniavirescens]